MSRIPITTQQLGPGLAPSSLPQVDPAQNPLSRFGRAVSKVADAGEAYLTDIANKQAAAEGLKKLSEFRVQQTQLMERLSTSAETPDGFTPKALQEFDREANSWLGKIENPRTAQFVMERLHDARADFSFQALKWETETRTSLRNQTLTDTLSNYQNLVSDNLSSYASAKADVHGAIDASGFDIAQAGAMKQKFTQTLARSAIYAEIHRNPANAKALIDSGVFDADLGADARLAAVIDAEQGIRQRDSEFKVQRSAESNALAGSLAVSVNRYRNGQGEFDQGLLEQAREKLQPDDFNRLQIAFDDARAFRTNAQAGVLNVAAKIEAGLHVDPGNAKERKAFDDYFATNVAPRLKAEVSKLPQEEQGAAYAARVIDFVGKQGIVPAPIMAEVRTSLRSGSPAAKIEAARLLDQLKAVNPQVLNDFAAQDIRAGNLIGTYVDSGMKPEEAVRTAEEILRRPADVSQELDRRFNAEAKDSPTADWLAGQMSGWWSTPSVSPTVSTEVSRVVRAEYQRNGGNLEAARRTALDQVKARSGPSTINGTFEVMRNPPERFYGVQWLSPDENAQAIRKEALTDITTGGATDGQLTEDSIKILPYPVRGVASPDGRPAYSISVQDSAGGWTVQMDTDPKSPTFGLPRPWWPSMGKVQQDRKQQIDDNIKSAREKRGGKGGPLDGNLKGSRTFDLPGALKNLKQGETFSDPRFGELRREGDKLVPVQEYVPSGADLQGVTVAPDAISEADLLNTANATDTRPKLDPSQASKFLVDKGREGAKLAAAHTIPRWLSDIEQARRQGRYAQAAVEEHYAKEISRMKREIAQADAKTRKAPMYQAFLKLGLME